MPRTRRTRPSDPELIRAVVDATRHLTIRGAARAVGVGSSTITRWRRGEHQEISGPNRGKVERYLLHHPPPPSPSADALTGSQRERAIRMLVTLRADVDRRIAEVLQALREG